MVIPPAGIKWGECQTCNSLTISLSMVTAPGTAILNLKPLQFYTQVKIIETDPGVTLHPFCGIPLLPLSAAGLVFSPGYPDTSAQSKSVCATDCLFALCIEAKLLVI